jgi:hypothetical protein
MTPRYKLRTLMILLAVLPPLLAGAWLWRRQFTADALIWLLLAVQSLLCWFVWRKCQAWWAERKRQKAELSQRLRREWLGRYGRPRRRG